MSGKRVTEYYNLEVLYPEISKEWNKKKNKGLTPGSVTPGSRKEVWWICSKGHEWKARVQKRVGGSGCPYCRGKKVSIDNCLATIKRELAKEWHPTKNGDLTPFDFTVSSGRKVWWKCRNGHVWKAMIMERSRGTKCPVCPPDIKKEKTLAYLYPELTAEMHPKKNKGLDPEKITMSLKGKIWWVCPKCGQEYQMTLLSRRKRRGCPGCRPKRNIKEKSLAAVLPALAAEWHPTKNGDLTPRDVSTSSWERVWWKCKNGHEFRRSVYSRKRKIMCPYCNRKKKKKDIKE